MSIIDTPFKTTTSIACLRSRGVRTVIRYYNFSNTGRFPHKRLESPEAEALSSHEMQIAVVFQQRHSQFEVIGALPFDQIVSVVSTVDGFARVDVEGDGQIDGFASAAFLEPV